MTLVNEITFGVEFETTMPSRAVAVGSYHTGQQVPWLPEGWLAKSDCSIHARRGRKGCEFVSPVLRGADGIAQVIEVLQILKERGAEVNASCGMHVHVGWSAANGDKAMNRLVTLVANFEKAIYAATGTKNRERGHWCRGLQSHGDALTAGDGASCNRYHVLNLTNLRMGRRPTVEFRAFAGTLNAIKAIGYIRLCLGLVERAMRASRATNFIAKTPIATSPIARNGQGQTALTRLFYQLGWTKGRTSHVFGAVAENDPAVPSIKTTKRELMRLARQYDRAE